MQRNTKNWDSAQAANFNSNQKATALAAINDGQRSVPCEKVRKTAPHCPDNIMTQTCHTLPQVINFFQ